MNINTDNLFIGMKFKPTSNNPTVYGLCKELTKDKFTFIWVDLCAGDPRGGVDHTMPLESAMRCFNLYGWRILSGLESELL